jgi:site-specific recombinase XerD
MSSQSSIKYPPIVGGNSALKLLDERIVKGFLTPYGNSKTKKTYRHCLEQFRLWILTLPGEYQGFNLIGEYRSYLQSKIDSKEIDRLSVYTAGLYMAVIKRYVKFLNENGLLEHNPAEKVKGFPRSNTHYRRGLDRNAEVPRLLSSIDTTTDIGIRDYAMVTILLYTGLRGFELSGLDFGDLDSIEGRPILWVRSKGRLEKSDYVILTEQPLKALRTYLATRPSLHPQAPLFLTEQNGTSHRLSVRSIQYRVNHYFELAGLKSSRITPHSLRHTAAIAALRSGHADIKAVQGMLRHRNEATTLIYLRSVSRMDCPAEDAICYGRSQDTTPKQEDLT